MNFEGSSQCACGISRDGLPEFKRQATDAGEPPALVQATVVLLLPAFLGWVAVIELAIRLWRNLHGS